MWHLGGEDERGWAARGGEDPRIAGKQTAPLRQKPCPRRRDSPSGWPCHAGSTRQLTLCCPCPPVRCGKSMLVRQRVGFRDEPGRPACHRMFHATTRAPPYLTSPDAPSRDFLCAGNLISVPLLDSLHSLDPSPRSTDKEKSGERSVCITASSML
jgi:hypothetical protein